MLDELKSAFEDSLSQNHLPSDILHYQKNKDRSYTVMICIKNYPEDGAIRKAPLCKVSDNGIFVMKPFLDAHLMPSGVSASRATGMPNYYKLAPTDELDVAPLFSIPSALILLFMRTYSAKAFGCCSQYTACSDARRCLHTDLLYAKGCMYRENLESGRIFYGVSRNII